MNKNKILQTTAMSLIFALAGCTYLDRHEGVTSFAGDAHAINEAKQTADPWNPNAYNNDIEGDGERLGDTVKRYKEGEQEEAQEIGNVSTNGS